MYLHHSGTFYKGVTHDLRGPFFPGEPYEVGSVHEAELSRDLGEACAPGIHVCLTIAEALRWGPRVVEVTIPKSSHVVMNGKLRVGPRVTVVRVDIQVGANLRGAYLRDANLRDANLGDANLWGANLRGADLGGANLRDANLWGANLGGANLRGADLGGANLRDANLWGANLRGADLGGANLGGADLGDAYLRGAYWTPSDGMPAGWTQDSQGLWVRA